MLKGSKWLTGSAWPMVDEVCHCGQSFDPKGRWHVGMEEKAANAIVESV